VARKTLTLHLAKPDVEAFDDLLSEEARNRLNLHTTTTLDIPDFGEGARLFVFVGGGGNPPWLRDLQAHFHIQVDVQTRSAAAVLMFRAVGRLFASTFAHGWMYLDEDQVEGDFGLRVALNALDETKLKRLERANLGDALRGVAQSPFQRELSSFGIDDALDLIRTISGVTRDDASADALTGSRSLKVSGEFSLADLPDNAAEALDFYHSDDYQETLFKIVDWVMPVDHRLSTTLDDVAVTSIQGPEPDFELGLPIAFDDDVAEFKFVGPGLRGQYPDLLLRHYRHALGNRLQTITRETLREHKVVAVFQGDKPDQRMTIRKALVGSIEHEGGRYAINEGEWYRLDEAFKESIERAFQDLVEDWDVQPEPLTKIYDQNNNGHYEAEYDYNRRFAAANGYVLLDTQLVEIPGIERSGFEACDVLDIAGKRFIHVKKSSRRSSILSHFFKQGSNAARQFSGFPAAWEKLEELVQQVAGNDKVAELTAARVDQARPWKVEFVIADTPRLNGQFNIPFFSKITLRDELINLRAMRYNVGLRFIGLDPGVPQA
jgi:uncharacterized protein (TIGR04141 family)